MIVLLLVVILGLLAGCETTELLQFEVQLTQKPCTEAHPDLSRIQLLAVPISAQGKLCVQTSHEVTPGNRSTTLEGGALDSEEVLLLALGYSTPDNCIRCYALARVLLNEELTKYSLDLLPTNSCTVPDSTLQGLGLPVDPLPPDACSD